MDQLGMGKLQSWEVPEQEVRSLLQEFQEGLLWPVLKSYLVKRLNSLEAEAEASARMEETFRSVYAKRILNEFVGSVESLIKTLKEIVREEDGK